jgi:hypothetical protein
MEETIEVTLVRVRQSCGYLAYGCQFSNGHIEYVTKEQYEKLRGVRGESSDGVEELQ